jgi:very-short-patch-repair endonuclease
MAPGVYLTAPSITFEDRLAASYLHAGTHSMISGAARLHVAGFKAVPVPPRSILVLVDPSCGARSTPTIQVRRTNLPASRGHAVIAFAPISRAVADLACRTDGLNAVRALVAEAVQRQRCTVAELESELAICGRNGRAHFRRAVMEIARGARSAPEAEAAEILTHAGLSGFRQNAEVRIGARRFIGDFLWEELRSILEIDSFEFHFERSAWTSTMERHAILESAGYSVIHMPPSALRDRYGFVDTVRRWLESRRQALSRR